MFSIQLDYSTLHKPYIFHDFSLSWRDIPGDIWVGGWYVEVNVQQKDVVDLSCLDFQWEGTPPYLYEKTSAGPKEVGVGPKVWKLTPEQEPMLGKKNGATKDYPPLAIMTQFLDVIVKQGFKIVGSNSMVLENNIGQSVLFVWSLVK